MDTHFRPDSSEQGFVMPFFSNAQTGNNFLQYPNTHGNATQSAPWTIYMHTFPGEHRLLLLDTGRIPLLRTTAALTATSSGTVYFADSLGLFRSLVTADEQKSIDTVVRIRLIHLSPDAGNVFITINDKPTRMLGGWQYMQASGYENFSHYRQDTFRVKLYQVGDTVHALSRAYLQVLPGRSYSLIVQGYLTGGKTYPAPGSNIPVTTTPNLQLLTNKSF
jgi:hypothetical protein